MNEMAKELQNIIDTLNQVTITGYDNMNRLMGSMQHLAKLRDKLAGMPEPTDAEGAVADA